MPEKKDYRQVIVEVKEAYDLADYMTSVGLELKSGGVGRKKLCCPFHTEKTPSCIVSEQSQQYHCFGCGAHGDIISFVQEYENLGFREALEKLAEAKNIEIEFSDVESTIDYRSIRKVLELTKAYYIHCFDKLPDGHPAHTEIRDRKLTIDNARFPLKYGYAPEGHNNLTNMLRKRGFSDDIMVQAGVAREGRNGRPAWDFFSGRLMFFLEDFNARPVGFSSRRLRDDDPMKGKYVNSPESEIFHKSRVLYNHPVARKATAKEKVLYVCEGQFDVAALVEAGLLNTVAASGTAFTREHVRECLKMVGDTGKLVFCFDGDDAGRNAANKVFLNFSEIHERAWVVTFPNGNDPCDFYMEHGSEKLVEYVNTQRKELPRFALDVVRGEHDLNSTTDRSAFVKQAARLIKSVPDQVLAEDLMSEVSLMAMTRLQVVRDYVNSAKPLTGEDTVQAVTPTHVDPRIAEAEEKLTEQASELVNLDELREAANTSRLMKLAVKIMSMSLTSDMGRRVALKNSKQLPAVFHPLLKELEAVKDKPRLLPEYFTDLPLLDYLSGELSKFYAMMTPDELRDHYRFLWSEYANETRKLHRRRADEKVMAMLMDNSDASADYLERLLEGSATS